MKKFFVMLLLFLLIPLVSLAESFPCSGTTKTGNLNVRRQPSTVSERATIIRNKGETVTILREEINRKGNKWYYVKLKNGRTGYVQAEYIDIDPYQISSGSHNVSFTVSHTGGENYNNVGTEWTFYYEVNGKQLDRKNASADFIMGEEYVFYARIREQDSIPDTGKAEVKYIPTEDDIVKGFTIQQKVRVEENSGPYRGKSVIWTIEWHITPVQ
ncbi:MAG: SH3 domain-containing protein [Clostridia bacterium]|nr:SH3 domain-containing protein [Clostridia bacterium]